MVLNYILFLSYTLSFLLVLVSELSITLLEMTAGMRGLLLDHAGPSRSLFPSSSLKTLTKIFSIAHLEIEKRFRTSPVLSAKL